MRLTDDEEEEEHTRWLSIDTIDTVHTWTANTPTPCVLLIVVKLKVSPADRVTYDYFIG